MFDNVSYEEITLNLLLGVLFLSYIEGPLQFI